jgi:hypothetical protein
MNRSAILIALLVLAVGFLGCNSSERKASKKIIAGVEQFRRSTGRLPKALSEIGLNENESCPCYCKTSNDSYMVWYGKSLGESDTYDSRTKQWSEAAGLVCAK